MKVLATGLRVIPVEGGEVACKVGGDGPVVVTTHPYSVPKEGLPSIPGTTTITVWPRGLGKSAPARYGADYGFRRLAQDLDTVRAHLGLDSWAFCGTSMGAFTGLVYGLAYPNTLTALVLDSGAASHRYRDDPDSIWPRMRATDAYSAYVANPTAQSHGAFWRTVFRLMGTPDPEAAYRHMMDSTDTPPEALAEIIRHIAEFDLRHRLTEIRVPTLVLAGERDVVCPPVHSYVLNSGIRGALLHTFPLGHGVIGQASPNVLGIVRGFIEDAQRDRSGSRS